MSHIVLNKDEIDEYLENLPPILKYNVADTDTVENTSFNMFSELPLELQNKIFQEVPKYSRNISKNYNSTFLSNYYENYCLKTALSERELINYFNSLKIGSTTEFSYFLIGHQNDDDIIIVNTEKYKIIKLMDNKYLVLDRHDENTYYDVRDVEELVFDIFGADNIDKTYLFLPSPSLLKDILSKRLSCKTDKYVDDYLYLMIKSFLYFFVEMPLVIADFIDNYLEISVDVDSDLTDELNNLNEGNFVLITDENSIQTSKVINKAVIDTYFV